MNQIPDRQWLKLWFQRATCTFRRAKAPCRPSKGPSKEQPRCPNQCLRPEEARHASRRWARACPSKLAWAQQTVVSCDTSL
eukprot:12645446-Alexandrium_andersonii.AAC.1